MMIANITSKIKTTKASRASVLDFNKIIIQCGLFCMGWTAASNMGNNFIFF